jgi:hypothetical protein
MMIELFAAIALGVAATTATLAADADADALPVDPLKNSTPSRPQRRSHPLLIRSRGLH